MNAITNINLYDLLNEFPSYGVQYYIALPGADGYYLQVSEIELKSKLRSIIGSNMANCANVIDDGWSFILVSVENRFSDGD